MNRIFKPRGYFTVPDGTDVSPFLNATDVMQKDVPWGALGELSIAAGRIKVGVASWIHMHPLVTQVTYVVSGQLVVVMKESTTRKPYPLELQATEAVLTEPGTLFQLRNPSTDDVVNVLYIVSPSYVFEMVGEKVVYDDAVLVSKTWEELEAVKYKLPTLTISTDDVKARRAESLRRLLARKRRDPGQQGEPGAT